MFFKTHQKGDMNLASPDNPGSLTLRFNYQRFFYVSFVGRTSEDQKPSQAVIKKIIKNP